MRLSPLTAAATLAFATVSTLAGAPSVSAADTMCGRPADMVQIVIEMQKPSVESLWRDKKLFVNRDAGDGSVWVFSVNNTTVHPAAICRRTSKDGTGKETVEKGTLCTAGEKACASFVEQAEQRLAKIAAGTR